MARSGKCRVLVAGGQAVAVAPPAPLPTTGLRLEVGAPVWTEIAKEVSWEPPNLSRAAALRDIRALRSDPPEPDDPPEVPAEDPRDVPLWKPVAVLKWSLDNGFWDDRQRRILSALWASDGDCEAAARSLQIHPDSALKMLTRAKSEVRQVARWMEYEDGFRLTRRSGDPKAGGRPVKLDDGRVWFAQKFDMICFLFDMPRRSAL